MKNFNTFNNMKSNLTRYRIDAGIRKPQPKLNTVNEGPKMPCRIKERLHFICTKEVEEGEID